MAHAQIMALLSRLWVGALGIAADAEDARPEAALLLLGRRRFLPGNNGRLRSHFGDRRRCRLLSDDEGGARPTEWNPQRSEQVSPVNGADVDRLGPARKVLGINNAIARATAIIGCQTTARAVDFNADNSRRRPERLGFVLVCRGHHESRP